MLNNYTVKFFFELTFIVALRDCDTFYDWVGFMGLIRAFILELVNAGNKVFQMLSEFTP
jgi:hypothetical protein